MGEVVIIDNDPDIVPVIRYHAKEQGVDAKIFQNGTEALEYLDNKKYMVDTILLDLMMSPLDGLTIAEEIRRNEGTHKPAVCIAFITSAMISEAVQRIAERTDVRKIFHKPCNYSEIFREIKTWS